MQRAREIFHNSPSKQLQTNPFSEAQSLSAICTADSLNSMKVNCGLLFFSYLDIIFIGYHIAHATGRTEKVHSTLESFMHNTYTLRCISF